MRVANENDRREKPECCDVCQTETDELERFAHYGPGVNVDWLCPYCSNCISFKDKEAIVQLMWVLERRLRR